jgi:hypothetical protein
LLFDAPHLELGTPQLATAVYVWQRRNKIELLKAYLGAAAQVNPKQAKKFADDLQQEIMPFLKAQKDEDMAKMQKVLNEETNKKYSVVPLDGRKPTKRAKMRKSHRR